MTVDDQQSLGFWNNSMVGLGVLFIIPALLVVGGFFVVAALGRPAGGVDEACTTAVAATLQRRTSTYTYQAGITPYQQQTLAISLDGGVTWNDVFDDVVQNPQDLPCEARINFSQIADDAYLAWHRKNVALSVDGGETWRVQNICDDPRPTGGRCDPDELDFGAVMFDDVQNGEVLVQRFVLDEYGQRVNADGSLRIAEEYALVTDDAAQNWSLVAEDFGT